MNPVKSCFPPAACLLTSLLLGGGAPVYAEPLEVKTVHMKDSIHGAECSYEIAWPAGGVSTQVLQRLRTTLLTEAWEVPQEDAASPGDTPIEHMKNRAAVLFDEKREDITERVEFARDNPGARDEDPVGAPWKEEASIRYLGEVGAMRVFHLEQYAYHGGAHGNANEDFLVFDEAGVRIPAREWFDPAATKNLAGLVASDLRKQAGLPPDAALRENGFDTEFPPPAQSLRPSEKGMVLFYNTYEIGCYAIGSHEVLIPWKDAAPLLSVKGKARLKGVLP